MGDRESLRIHLWGFGARFYRSLQTSILPLKVPTVSITITMPSAPKPAPEASQGVSYDWLTEKEKPRAWFTAGSVCYVGSIQKWAAAALQPFSETTLKNSR